MSVSNMTKFLKPGILVSAIFTPSGLHKLSKVNMSDLTDKSQDPIDLIGKRELMDWRSQIFEAASLQPKKF